jgi:endonuclease/exonuclease/phosphatase family metal-dependent hydrolase
MGPLIYFATSGTHTIRVQAREDGLAIDQIVLSAQSYLSASPGAFRNDSTILPKGDANSPPPPNQPPQASISVSATSGVSPLTVYFTSNALDPDGVVMTHTWNYGDGQTSSEISPAHVYQAAGTYTARLTVTDNSGATASAAVTITVSSPPPPSGGTRFKVLHWNVAYGRGTDNILDLNRQATWMANMSADLISLNEVPPGDAQRYADLLRQKTGVTWNYHWVAITPGDSVGQQILTKHPIVSRGTRYLSFGRSVAQATVSIGGRNVNFFSTHLSFESASWRVTQITEMAGWMAGFAEPRIVAGDYNLSPNWAEYINMTTGYDDSWAEAVADNTATSYPDNPEGRTRKGRVDYINYSESAWNLTLVGVRVPDQRDLNNRNVVITVGNSNDWGVRPSDHNFVLSTFEVR